MAHFKILRTDWKKPCLLFYVRILSGEMKSGDIFAVYDTHHRYLFEVTATDTHSDETLLTCKSDFLQHITSGIHITRMFSGKEVDTEDPTVAVNFAYKWSADRSADKAKRRRWWAFWT